MTRMQSQPAFPTYHRRFANPAPLGLCGFALTTFMLSLINSESGIWLGHKSAGASGVEWGFERGAPHLDRLPLALAPAVCIAQSPCSDAQADETDAPANLLVRSEHPRRHGPQRRRRPRASHVAVPGPCFAHSELTKDPRPTQALFYGGLAQLLAGSASRSSLGFLLAFLQY